MWTWQLEDADGELRPAPEEAHQSQGDAESWLGLNWRDLAEQGVAAVVLMEDDRVEYRMDLAAAAE